MKEKLESIIQSKEISYWGFLVPAMVNSIACFMYSGGSNATLGIINEMLMLFFTGCYYLFCLYYFWDKEKAKGVITYFLFIAIPLVIYWIFIQPIIIIDNRAIDIVFSSLYYMAFYGLFIIKHEPSKKVKYVVLILSWLIFSPLFLLLSWKWKNLGKWKRITFTIISPSSLILAILIVVGSFMGYSLLERRYKFTGRETLCELTGVMLPKFKVIDRKEGKRSFTGDYCDEIIIQFKDSLSSDFYLQLDSICSINTCWSKSKIDSKTRYHYERMWGNGMPAPQGQDDDEDYFFNIEIQQNSQEAKITCGMW